MDIKINQTFTTLDGKQLPTEKEYIVQDSETGEFKKDEKGNLLVAHISNTEKPLQLKTILTQALLDAPSTTDTAEEKVKKYQLALKINSANEVVSLSAEEIVLIKGLVSVIYTPLIVGQTFNYLEI